VIDMVCYRRHGHNEGDDPSYTQPLMYKRILTRRSVRKLYTETLVRRGDISVAEAERALDDFMARMQGAFDETRQSGPPDPATHRSFTATPGALPSVPTGVDRPVLDRVVEAINRPPDGFTVHPKLVRQMTARRHLWDGGEVDWTLAESLAFGSLILEGTDVRLTGQDSRRGTFSQRHALLVDYETGAEWVALASLADTDRHANGKMWIYDSMLSEYAALGFEYGYSVVHKDALVCWEAQFGDFANAAQVVIDQFIASAESKWAQTSGLVLLLPHGFEGQGPEHSSARLERFLTLCAGDNLTVVNATTAAQYFHVLRRQVRRHMRTPLVLLTPKSLLRAHRSRSAVADLTAGSFREVLDDTSGIDPGDVRRVVLASGKVAYDVMAERDRRGLPVPVVRVEQLNPWPEAQLVDALARYREGTEVAWLQEEPENMGAWPFVHERLHRQLRDRFTLRHVSRVPSASPATGSHTVHQHEQDELIRRVLAGL
jgi:2-oxoglutarate dehydrogenase E1 component